MNCPDYEERSFAVLYGGLALILFSYFFHVGVVGEDKKKTHTFETTSSNITTSSLPFLLQYWSHSMKWTEQEKLSVTIINKMKDPSIIFPTLFVRK